MLWNGPQVGAGRRGLRPSNSTEPRGSHLRGHLAAHISSSTAATRALLLREERQHGALGALAGRGINAASDMQPPCGSTRRRRESCRRRIQGRPRRAGSRGRRVLFRFRRGVCAVPARGSQDVVHAGRSRGVQQGQNSLREKTMLCRSCTTIFCGGEVRRQRKGPLTGLANSGDAHRRYPSRTTQTREWTDVQPKRGPHSLQAQCCALSLVPSRYRRSYYAFMQTCTWENTVCYIIPPTKNSASAAPAVHHGQRELDCCNGEDGVQYEVHQ